MSNTTTTSVKKPTKRDRFNALLAIPAVAENTELVEFINHELELLAKRNVSVSGDKKLTEKQKQNVEIGEAVVATMEQDRLYTITELLKIVPGLPEDMTNQRMTHIVSVLVDANRVKRTIEKRKSYFSLV